MPRKKRSDIKPLVNNGQRTLLKSERHAVRLFGDDLQDAREEMFVRMVADGLSMGVSYARAGFVAKTHNAAQDLFKQPHIQRRIDAVLEARRTQGVVTLPEVTDMLKRVFAGANSEGEYSAAHNAAFSLARIYGHVTDKATLEVLRRPSREPDAPSEQVLGDWVASLPGPTIDLPAVEQGSNLPLRGTPAPLLGLEPVSRETKLYAYNSGSPAVLPLPPVGHTEGISTQPIDIIDVASPSPPSGNSMGRSEPSPEPHANVHRPSPELHADVHRADGPDGTENGASVGPVTGTPTRRGRSPLLGKPIAGTKQVPVKKRAPSGAQKRKARKLKNEMKDLFG